MQTIINRLKNGWTEHVSRGEEWLPIHRPPSSFDKRVLSLIEQLLQERDGAIRVLQQRENQLNYISHAYENLERIYNELLERSNNTGHIQEAVSEPNNHGRGASNSEGETTSSEKPAS